MLHLFGILFVTLLPNRDSEAFHLTPLLSQMTQTIFTNSLFPEEKGNFDWEHFQSTITSPPSFLEWLKSGFNYAISVLNTAEWTMSKRLWSTNAHECVFNALQDSLSSYGDIANRITFNISTAGNERNHFIFGGYVFILKKEDATSNNTQISERIQNQEVSAHVITMEYAVTPLRDSLNSIRLSYYDGKHATYSMNLPLSPAVNILENPEEVAEIIPSKPRLNKKGLDTAVG